MSWRLSAVSAGSEPRWHPQAAQVWRVGLGMLVFLAALYPVLATRGKWEVRPNKEEAALTLDGMAFMDYVTYNDNGQEIRLNEDYEALKWMQRNISGTPVVAEAQSNNPYRSIGNRVAMYTGLPSIIGWDWHQRQQRPTLPGDVVSRRIDDVNRLYNSPETWEMLAVIEKYDVSYIYSGELERAYYGDGHIGRMNQLVDEGRLQVVYSKDSTQIYQVVTPISAN
ncbi:MAG: hypothetical protein AAGD96_32880 [Chloroflexota bacterium]